MMTESSLQRARESGKRSERGARSPRVQRKGRRGPGKLEASAIVDYVRSVSERNFFDFRRWRPPPLAWFGEVVENGWAKPSPTAIRQRLLGTTATSGGAMARVSAMLGKSERGRERGQAGREKRGARRWGPPYQHPRSILESRGGRAGTDDEEVVYGTVEDRNRGRRPGSFRSQPPDIFFSFANQSLLYFFFCFIIKTFSKVIV